MTTLALSSLTELNKNDKSRSFISDWAKQEWQLSHFWCFFFHVLVRRCDINEVTLTTIWANWADEKFMISSSIFFPENRLWRFMQIVSRYNLYEMSKPVFWNKKIDCFNVLCWYFTQHVKRQWLNANCDFKVYSNDLLLHGKMLTLLFLMTSKKPTDLDLHCLSLSMWISIKNSDQVIWLTSN